MTDEPAQVTAPEPDPSRDRARIEPSPARSTDLLPGLYLLGFIVLAGAMYYLWANPPESKLAPQEASRVETLQTQIATLRDEVATLRAKPAGPSAADLARLQQRIEDVAARPPPPPVSLLPVENRLAALEQRPTATPEQVQQLAGQVISLAKQTPDIQPIVQRIDALEKRPPFDPSALEAQQKQTAAQIGQITGRVDDTATKLVAGQKEIGGRVEALEQATKQNADQIKAVAQKAQLATRLQGISTALAAGNKLGDIPGAPPALARFANEAPPTESGLRGAFDSYAEKAQAASQPDPAGGQSFTDRMWSRAQQSVTVRQGDHVLVGDPVAGILAHARELLDRGDLAGAVQTVGGLSGAPAAAMQPWTDRAQALLDARAALASMAAS